jgi:TldD protein
VTLSRRDFVHGSAALAAAAALARPADALGPLAAAGRPLHVGAPGDPTIRALALRGLDAARSAGASYADVRIGQNRSQAVATRERRVQGLADSETAGVGVRALVDGAWGFAATSDLTPDGVAGAARRAVAQARANRAAQVRPVQLAPVTPTPNGEWRSPIEVDPFAVPVADKVALLLAANEAAMKVPGVRFVNSSMSFLREEKTFASTDGTFTAQTLYRASPQMNVTAVSRDMSDFQTRESTEIPPLGLGYEHVTRSDLVGAAPRLAADAVQKLSAKPVEVGRYDLVLHPSHLFLTIHESVAHPTELDRALGFEANFAGTSFVSPPEAVLGKLRYGPPIMNVQADRSQVGSLAACGWDDEGVRPETYMIIKDGVVVDYQTTREQAPYLAPTTRAAASRCAATATRTRRAGRTCSSSACPTCRSCRATRTSAGRTSSRPPTAASPSWGAARSRSTSSATTRSSAGRCSTRSAAARSSACSRTSAYQMRTPEFWGAMDIVGGKKGYMLYGSPNDGKGQPSQSNAVSHGCPPTRHRQINVINTGRTA